MQKKIFAWAMSMAVAAMIACTGCTQNSSTSSGTDSETAQTTTLEETDGSVSSQNLSAVQSGTAGVTTDVADTASSVTNPPSLFILFPILLCITNSSFPFFYQQISGVASSWIPRLISSNFAFFLE